LAAIKNSYENIRNCRISGSSNIGTILDLGNQPLANALKKLPNDPEEKFPLTLMFCHDSSLVQLRETVDKKVLFTNYIWVTGTSASTRQYAKVFFERAIEKTEISHDDLIVEIASNDGTFLKPFIQNGYNNVLGVDPAINIVSVANQQGVRTLDSFWDRQVAQDIVSKLGSAKIVMARNVIPHVSELHDVVEGIEHCLRDDGVAIIEFHNAGQILQDLHYDSIYHEHLCFFSIKSISCLFEQYDLLPFHIDPSPISGGSYVIFFSKKKREQSKYYLKAVEEEEELGVNEARSWVLFAKTCYEHRKMSREIAESSAGKTVLGFGASARSSTYLNFCGFGTDHMQAIIDNNPMKHGLYPPGSSIPIVSFNKGMDMKPDLIFILAWNFRDEIVQECRSKGYRGEFLVPFPNDPYYYGLVNEIYQKKLIRPFYYKAGTLF